LTTAGGLIIFSARHDRFGCFSARYKRKTKTGVRVKTETADTVTPDNHEILLPFEPLLLLEVFNAIRHPRSHNR